MNGAVIAMAIAIVGTLTWFFATLTCWAASYSQVDKQRYARLVLATPVWPLILCVLLAHGVYHLWRDAFLRK
jgi:hypothetical protein